MSGGSTQGGPSGSPAFVRCVDCRYYNDGPDMPVSNLGLEVCAYATMAMRTLKAAQLRNYVGEGYVEKGPELNPCPVFLAREVDDG